MTWTLPFLSLLFLALTVSADRYHRFQLSEPLPSEMPSGVETAYFPNRVDHFNLSSKATYDQRYWYSEDYWDAESGPMILYIHGESPGRILGDNTMVFELAKRVHGKVFMLEHRFYGTSQPCEDWSVKCLRLLNHHQALADIANFIQVQTNALRNRRRKWIIIGGSYAGALAGWFKSKYPHLAHIIYSSSGVINAITDYHQYMDQVKNDLAKDPKCYSVVLELNQFAQKTIEQGTKEEKDSLKNAMNASMLNDLDFLSYFTDMYVGAIQYSSRRKICKEIVELEDERDLLKRAKKYATIGAAFRVLPTDYTFEEEKKITINPHTAGRQWMYQFCTAFGWFQTGRKNPLRPDYLGTEYWRKQCKNVFGTELYPNEAYTNARMGDLRPVDAMTKAIFVNGGDDPWQWAGIRSEDLTNDKLLVSIIKCDDCAHCLDLHASSNDDPSELTEVRKRIMETITHWVLE